MTLPTRADQIKAVARLLDSEQMEGKSLDEIAAQIVDGYLSAITPRRAPHPLRVGMLLKDALSNKVQYVAWMNGGEVWVVGETSSYGYLTSANSVYFEHCEEYKPKRRVVIDGKGKMVEMTDQEIEEAWSNPDWKLGDKLSQHQREFQFEVIATGPQCALLRRPDGRLVADSNRNLEAYYRREGKLGGEW